MNNDRRSKFCNWNLRRQKGCGAETVFEEIGAENFPNVTKDTAYGFEKLGNHKNDKPKEIHTKTNHD